MVFSAFIFRIIKLGGGGGGGMQELKQDHEEFKNSRALINLSKVVQSCWFLFLTYLETLFCFHVE